MDQSLSQAEWATSEGAQAYAGRAAWQSSSKVKKEANECIKQKSHQKA